MGIPYKREFQFSAVAGQANMFELPAPSRGTLRSLIVEQRNGAMAGFSYDLFDRDDCCGGIAESDNPDDGTAHFSNAIHKIYDTQTVSGPTTIGQFYDKFLPYENRDEQDDRRTPKSKIYLCLTPSGTGTKLFHVGYTVTTDWE